MNFKSKKPHYEYLRKKWTAKAKQLSDNVLEKHFRKAALGSLGGLMLLTTPGMPVSGISHMAAGGPKITGSEDKNALLKVELLDKVPMENRNLTKEEEAKVEQVLTKNLGVNVKAEIDGKRLNRTYGLIGGEQHLYRYPGDTLISHARTTQDWAMFGGSGIAPGLGAWGYFAPSKEQFTKRDEERERWYVVAQTFLSPGFAERTAEYRDFYKFRKVVVVNPKTGQAVIGDIGDAGPGESTGKSFGGSPEVMHELGLAGGPRKGAVLFFFIEDPNDQIPLGPIRVTQDNQFVKS